MRLILFTIVIAFGLSACVATGPVGPIRDSATISRDFSTVVHAIEPVAEAFCRQRNRGRNCDFRIVIDDRRGMPANAFQFIDEENNNRPVVGFTIALIADVWNQDEMAFILAHEMAHHIARHLEAQQRNAAIGAADFGRIASLGGGNAKAVEVAQALGAATGAAVYSKQFELEADALGAIIAERAGFDAINGAQYFNRIPDPGNVFLGSHPPNAARLEIVKQTVARL